MKATLIFKLPEEQEEYQTAMDGGAYKVAVWNIRQELFRPYRKHGYGNPKLQRLIEDNPAIIDFMHELESMLNDILGDLPE